MNSSNSSKLPTWVFIVTDLAFVGLAIFIGSQSAHPLSTTAVLAIVGCMALGVIVGLLPLIIRAERLKNEALDDRQRALEALARTVSGSAEQISIAASGLHEVAEIAQRNLKHAEQLPHKLQDKIAEFQAQLAAAEDAEKEELERELLSLRTTESERLETVSQRITKSSAEWAKLEQATQQHLAAATEALSKLSLGTAAAIGKAQAAAEQALGHARVEAARNIGDASGQATRAVDAAKTAALAELDARISAAVTRLEQALDRKMSEFERRTAAMAAPVSGSAIDRGTVAEPERPAEPAISSAEAEAAPAKRARKPRREEPAEAVTAPEPAPTSAQAAVDVPIQEPTPIPAERIQEVAPVAPVTMEPFDSHQANGSSATVANATPASTLTAPEVAKPRKRAVARKTEEVPQPGLALEVEDAPAAERGTVGERVLTSDGATRILVTAYIGIGNRLFIRGEGPGLSWEKGAPLQFVSIGKWRWETNDASAPLRFKLYKNDDLECAALGAQTLDPGYQQELTAAF